MKIINSAGQTDVGIKRELNEDYYLIDKDLGLLLVADGMGGHDAGEVASTNSVKIFHEHILSIKENYSNYAHEVIKDNTDNDKTWENLPNPLLDSVKDAIQTANSNIYAINKEKGYRDNQGMGTTFVGIWVLKQLDEAVIFHVGDSRLYLLRDEHLGQMTIDQSLHQIWVEYGKIGPEPGKNVILSAIGLKSTVTAHIRTLAIQENDVFLLCSDGLSDLVEPSEIARILKKTAIIPLQDVCNELITAANEAGGTDNITVSLISMGN